FSSESSIDGRSAVGTREFQLDLAMLEIVQASAARRHEFSERPARDVWRSAADTAAIDPSGLGARPSRATLPGG
ncbi:hypothetical protein, partial [Enterobacter hormaechei]|uniref:hypothetical protein n=1 Tax=Enterobacter hormaechei TaxID=158836 RepID=UPI001954962E